MKINLNKHVKFCAIAFAGVMLGACTDDEKLADDPTEMSHPGAIQAEAAQGSGKVFVHLFEWRWKDIAAECENFLGPNGYAAVQISPPNEHVIGPAWWTRYQPVSYKIESRSGTRAEFADMVRRCKQAGVEIYADALTNHMADVNIGASGVAGSVFSEFTFPGVPYDHDDFHHCGRNDDGHIENYQDLWEVQNCSLGQLPDLDTGNPAVQAKIAAYLNDLLSLGVTGFRLDAVKHVSNEDVSEILALVNGNPFVFQEVIDRGGEPINAMDYLPNGQVTEFKYPIAIIEAFEGGQLGILSNLGLEAGFLPADKAVVFTDNHDLQRGHAGGDVLNHKHGELYDLANVFMLAWPYGYPKVMSSYYFEDTDQGPPDTLPVKDGACTAGWVCEHRRPSRVGMVRFRKVTEGMPVTNWQAFGDEVVSFGRSDKGHVIINISEDTVDGTFVTGMKAGEYCNVALGGTRENDCYGAVVLVDKGGVLQISIAPMSAVAIHAESLR